MRSKRHDAPGTDDSFELDVNNTLVGFFSKVTGMFGAVMGGIALIALVVGGIVIMNMMLVSVTERTREIGIRKALGARGHDIMLQFLVESGAMALVGGFFGVMGRNRRGAGGDAAAGVPVDGGSVERAAGAGDGGLGGDLFRGVSGAQGGQPGPDRGVAGGAVSQVRGTRYEVRGKQ